MPIYQLEDIPEELVTPKHSTAYGRLITGTQVEVGAKPAKTTTTDCRSLGK